MRLIHEQVNFESDILHCRVGRPKADDNRHIRRIT